MKKLPKNPLIKHVIQRASYWIMRARIWWFGRNLRWAIREVMEMPVDQTGPIITKWKWDASRISDPDIRDAMLTGVYGLEKYLKQKNENSHVKTS